MDRIDPYSLDKGFEADVVGYLITDRQFFGSVVAGLQAKAFPTIEAQVAVGLCIAYYHEHGSSPGNARVFAQVLHRHCMEERKITIEMLHRVLEYVNEALDALAPMEPVLREFSALLTQRVQDDAARELLMNRDYDAAAAAFTNAKALGQSDRSRGLGLTLKDEVVTPEDERRVPTGIAVFDYLSKGGAAPGSLLAFLAHTGDGKSLALAQMAAAAIREGLPVLVHACEMTDHQVRYRIIADLVSIPYEDLEDNRPGARDRADQILARMSRACGWGQLSVKYTVPDDGTPDDTEAFAEDFERDYGVAPALIVVDYADRITDGGRKDRTDYQIQGRVWQAYQIMAARRKCVVATASQAKDLAKGQRWLGTKNFADCARKPRFSDIVLSINWNASKTEGGLHIAKGRKGLPVGRTLRIVPAFEYSRISEVSERVKAGMRPSEDRRRGDYGGVMQFLDALVDDENTPAPKPPSFG